MNLNVKHNKCSLYSAFWFLCFWFCSVLFSVFRFLLLGLKAGWSKFSRQELMCVLRGCLFDRLRWGLSAGTGKLCIFGHLGLVFIWSCFVSCLLLLLYYVICAPVLTEGTLRWEIESRYTASEQS